MNKSVLENKSNPIKLWCQQDIGYYENNKGINDIYLFQ